MYIVATISKNSYPADKVREILQAGARLLRYNFAHGTPAEMQEKISVARTVIAKLGLTGQVVILADLPGAKVRLGYFPGGEHPVTVSQELTFSRGDHSPDPTMFIPVDFAEPGSLVQTGQEISLADGEIGFRVTAVINPESFRAEALNTGHVPAGKALNVGRNIDSFDHLTPVTREHLGQLHLIRPDWVAFSFVRDAEFLRQAKALLPQLPDWHPKVVAKVESPQGLEHLPEICQECNVLLVARGDLGVNCPIEELGIAQKRIVRTGHRCGRQVIVSTQILDSLTERYLPSRAEVLDLTNIVLDGADGIMLAKETGISPTPGRSVSMAKRIIECVEQHRDDLK